MIDVVAEAAVYGSISQALGTAYLIPFYCIFVAMWSQFMLEFWKRKEATRQMEW